MRTLLLLLALASSAFAGLEIKKARYGNTAAYNDVRGIVEAYVRNSTLSFPISSKSMGGDPTGRGPNYFYIEYEVNGRAYTDTVPEGKVFTFQGINGVKPVSAGLMLPFLKIGGPTSAPLALVNRSGSPARAYNIDRFGRWGWGADLEQGRTVSLSAQVGEQWIIANEAGGILARQRIGRGQNVLIAEPPGSGQGGYRPGAEEAWVRFDNSGYRTLYLYNLDALGRWNWMATLEPSGGYSASTRVGEAWIATDTTNHVVRNVTVPPGQSRIPLN